MKKTSIRFFKYFAVGFSTFLLDLLLLYVLTDFLLVSYVLAAGLAFLTAVTINHYFSRKFVFTQTTREFNKGYVGFMLISLAGALAVMGLMFLFVSVFAWQYLISRVVIAAIVGIWNYLMNLFVNFKVAGIH